jgi:hypothetical protein
VLGAAAAAVFAQACADGDAARDDACLFERALARRR